MLVAASDYGTNDDGVQMGAFWVPNPSDGSIGDGGGLPPPPNVVRLS